MRLLVVTKPKFFSSLIHQVLNPPISNFPQKIAPLNTCYWVCSARFWVKMVEMDPQPSPVGEWGCRGVTAHPGQELQTY